MGYRCHDACGLAAAAVAKVSGGALGAAGGIGSGSDDDDLDGAGDVEMGEFYSGEEVGAWVVLCVVGGIVGVVRGFDFVVLVRV